MAALGWLLNLDFAASGVGIVTSPCPDTRTMDLLAEVEATMAVMPEDAAVMALEPDDTGNVSC